ncbi:TetR/AcrR family transcriptional regulator C-terminal domain-containing protein [Streptomyces sp. NPDC005548]|uniref:TetR/AcrR family transcriptional regulator C-terminal domain-containing protein n=1 Tax=Streptomyces sp. NPDC005548 TaxID=3364724 RepID=UPI00369D8F3B
MRARALAVEYETVCLDGDALAAARSMAQQRLPAVLVVDAEGTPKAILPATQMVRLLSTPLARRAPAVLRSDERVLALLQDAGLDDRQSVLVHRAFTAWVLGYLLVELRAMEDEPA